MMRIFTYHEVRAQPGGENEGFYTISAEQLSHHLETFNNRGWQSVCLKDLNNSPSENQYALTFDDGTKDHHEVVLPVLQKHGCRASFYIPTAKLNRHGYLTDSQLREIAAAGNEIGSHSHEHERMDRFPEEEVRKRIGRSMEIIGGILGEAPQTFVPPGGFMNETIRRVAGELGMKTVRTMRWGYNLKLDLMELETVPINRYTDHKKFVSLLEPRGPSLVYVGKEALKKIIPLRNYERLRGLVFKLRK